MAGNVRVVLKSVFDDKGIKKAQAEFGKVGKTLGVTFAAVGAAAATAAVGLARFGSDSIAAAENVAQANNRLGQVAKSMGIFGAQTQRVTDRLINFAEANELTVAVDAEVIKATQAKLLTFKNLAATAGDVGGAMDRATMAALDLAAAGFGSAETNAIQLGKALQDPIKGITALARSGVTFTAQEKLKIKTLVESGKVLEAQDLILKAIETQVGGTAEATAKSSDKMKLAFENISEAVGEALLPVFNEFSEEILKLTPELEEALAPAAAEVAAILRDEVVPAIKDFTTWLASPEGTEKVRELTTAVINGIDGFFELAEGIVDNWDALKNLAIFIGAAAIALAGLRTAITLTTAAQLLFNAAALANPYVALIGVLALAATAAVTAGTALSIFAEEEKKAREEATGFTGRIAELAAEQDRLKELFDAGVISFAEYEKAVGPVNSELAKLQGELKRATSNALNLNNASLAKFRGQLGDTRVDAEKLVNAQRELAFYVNGGKPGTYKPFEAGGGTGGGTGGGGGKGGAKANPVEEAKKRYAAIQKIIQEHQKKLAAAQKAYNAEVFTLNEESEKNIKALREKAAADQLALVAQSKKRLTDAFATATQTALSSLFNSKTVQELTKSVKRVTAALTITTTQETERIINGSVGDVIEGLRKKILGARTLIQNASKLAGLGFSQTFIEQVIEGGTETGNELANAILEASPETQAELRKLFLELEDVTENGMGALATKIYNEQGLATQELKKLYTDVSKELNDALLAEQTRLASALVAAGLAFNLAVLQIKDDFLEAISVFDGAFAGLGNTIKQFLGKLDGAAAGATTDVQKALTGQGGALEGASITGGIEFKTLAPIKAATGLVLDSVDDIAGAVAYLQERINAGNSYIKNVGANSALGMDARGRVTGFEAELAALRGRAAAGTAAGTTININVKTDSTQSQAMVGKTIGNIVTKYVTTGGQVLVSGNN